MGADSVVLVVVAVDRELTVDTGPEMEIVADMLYVGGADVGTAAWEAKGMAEWLLIVVTMVVVLEL